MVCRLLPLAVCLTLTACAAPPERPEGEAQRTDIALPAQSAVVRGVVPQRTTLATMLRSHGLDAAVVERTVSEALRVFDLRRLRALQPFSLVRTIDGALREFEYEIDEERYLRISTGLGSGDGLRAEILPIARTLEHATAVGIIDADAPSLFQSMTVAGENENLALALADVFSGEIDFNTGLQRGDRFGVAFERYRRERDGRASYGAITAAEFHNDGRTLRAIRFTPVDGKPGYYDERGRSLRRFFLRSPLKFEPRITSGFSLRRMHPVLHTARAHRGVDYGAPTGAPVIAVASGTVVSATFDRTNGRMVRLRHPSGYESYYLHLSAFAAGIRAGARVGQGEPIGRVGATGLATGPHLHYGLTKNGVFVNPLREHSNMPPGEPIAPSDLDAFAAVRDAALAAMGAPSAATPQRPSSTPRVPPVVAASARR